MSKAEIEELINRSEIVNKYLRLSHLQGFNVYSGNEFSEWLADITSVVSSNDNGTINK